MEDVVAMMKLLCYELMEASKGGKPPYVMAVFQENTSQLVGILVGVMEQVGGDIRDALSSARAHRNTHRQTLSVRIHVCVWVV